MHMCTIKNRIDDSNYSIIKAAYWLFFSISLLFYIAKKNTFINEKYKTSLDLLKKIILQEDLSITKIYSHFIKPEGTVRF